MALILKNATFIDWESLKFTHTNLIVEQINRGEARFIRDLDKINISPEDEIIDCKGKIVTKSFGIGHIHVYSALARGMPLLVEKPAGFQEMLKKVWWVLNRAMDKDIIEASALATALACAKSGTTFVVDHHSSPAFISGSLDIIANTFEKVGLNHLLCYEITDRDGLDKARQGLEETNNYLNYRQGLVGMHASFTVGEETMKRVSEIVEKYNSGVHIHVAETLYDQQYCLENYNRRVLERLNDYGFLNSSKTLLAHCLYIEEYERELLRNSFAYIVQNPESNMKNRLGPFSSIGLDGDRLMLGTDGMHADQLQSSKAAFLIGQAYDNIDFESAYKRFRNIHKYIDKNDFDGDGKNNLVVIDYDSPTPVNRNNFLNHFIFGIKSDHILHVISNGKLIVKDRVLQGVDEEEILGFTREQAKRLWSRMKEISKTD